MRWGGALGLAPVPGPFDEAVLLLVEEYWLFYRDQLTEAWQRAERLLRFARPLLVRDESEQALEPGPLSAGMTWL